MRSAKSVIGLAVLVFCVATGLHGVARADQPIDVIFDLDWTSIYTTNAASVAQDSSHLVTYAGKTYRFSDHLAEALLKLHETPGVRVSFFSGGDFERNTEVVRVLYEEVNRLAGHPGKFEPFRLRSSGDLTVVGSPPKGAKFPDRFKKDLHRVDESVNLDRAVIVDDISKFAVPGQERNFLWLKETYDDIPDYKAWFRSPHPAAVKFPPPNEAAWALERNKIAWTLGTVLEARERSIATGKPFVECLNTLIHDANGALLARSETSQLALLRRGLHAMGLPETPFVRVWRRPGGACAAEVRGLLRALPAVK